MSPFFSIIIPSLNEEKNLPILLKSLTQQTNRDFEIIIVDCFSKDKTKQEAEIFKKMLPNLNFISYKSKNVSQARNYGTTLAKGKYFIFFDADVCVENNFIKEIKEKIEINKLDALTVWNRPKEKGFMPKFILGLLNISMTIFQKIKPAANGPCIIIKKEIFEKIKRFDDTIVFGEDFDLIQKAWKIGAKFSVFSTPYLFVSTRRFEKEGIIVGLYKSFKAILYQLFFGPIRKPIFDYQMGGQYYMKTIYQTSAGGIVYKKIGNWKLEIGNSLWLICKHSLHKGWVFPKGLVGDTDSTESMESAALREVAEEGGIKAKIINEKPIKVQYSYKWQDSLIHKTVYYFLMEYLSGDPKDHDWEMSEAKFVSEEEAKKTLTYKSDRQAFEKILLSKNK